MTTATMNVPQVIGIQGEHGTLLIPFNSASTARQDPSVIELAKVLKKDLDTGGLTPGQVTEREVADWLNQHELSVTSSMVQRYRDTLTGAPSFQDFMEAKFEKLVPLHVVALDQAYRLLGMDPQDGENLPMLFGNPMFSYENDGFTAANVLWDYTEQVFQVVMEQAGFTAYRQTPPMKDSKPARKNAKRKAASKARKASKKK